MSNRSLAAAILIATATVAGQVTAQPMQPMLRITSPLGRTGLPGTIRIVARLDGIAASVPVTVRFYVDEVLLSSDTDGPPYDARWVDDSPFDRRELMARADLPSGGAVEDVVVLKPLEITEATEVTSVAVDTSVLDRKGRFAPNLSKADFALFEDDEPQDIELVLQQREPAVFALLVDSSQSMATRGNAVRAAAAGMLSPVAPEDQIIVAPFARTITSVTGPTTDRATVLGAISAIHHGGGTAIFDALRDAANTLEIEARRRAIVLITDGYDENSQSGMEAAVQALRQRGIALYVVGIGGIAGISLKGERLLSQIAEDTGGHAWFPRDDRQLGEIYELVASDVQHKYLITYTPRNQKRDGRWRAIDVKVGRPELQVRARKGYTAPIAPPIRASLEFTAESADYTPVSLSVDDLVLTEDGVRQTVDTFHEAVMPVTFMLALDSSGSMKSSAARAQDAAREFVAAMRPEDEVGTIVFADEPELIHSPTADRGRTLEAIDRYVASGGTALYDALYESLVQLDGVAGRQVVVVVTDGRDENARSNGPGSLRTWDDVLDRLQKSDVTVYAVGIGTRVDRQRLQELATRSGGAAYFPSDVTTLAAEYHKILDELRRRYVVGWESSNRQRDGHWRNVEIRATPGRVRIKSRNGYFPPDN